MLNVLTVLSALACVAVCVLWVRSYWHQDSPYRAEMSPEGLAWTSKSGSGLGPAAPFSPSRRHCPCWRPPASSGCGGAATLASPPTAARNPGSTALASGKMQPCVAACSTS
jgi:hypothetical protein